MVCRTAAQNLLCWRSSRAGETTPCTQTTQQVSVRKKTYHKQHHRQHHRQHVHVGATGRHARLHAGFARKPDFQHLEHKLARVRVLGFHHRLCGDVGTWGETGHSTRAQQHTANSVFFTYSVEIHVTFVGRGTVKCKLSAVRTKRHTPNTCRPFRTYLMASMLVFSTSNNGSTTSKNKDGGMNAASSSQSTSPPDPRRVLLKKIRCRLQRQCVSLARDTPATAASTTAARHSGTYLAAG